MLSKFSSLITNAFPIRFEIIDEINILRNTFR
jgi:hypothetical protein